MLINGPDKFYDDTLKTSSAIMAIYKKCVKNIILDLYNSEYFSVN